MARAWLLGEAWGDTSGGGVGVRANDGPAMTPVGVQAAALFSMHIFDQGGRGLPQDPRVPAPPEEERTAVEPQDVVTDPDDKDVQFKYNSLVR